MRLRSPRFLASALIAAILVAGSAVYGWLRGIPQWSAVLNGEFIPWLSAFGGWAVAIGIVALGSVLVGISVVVSWIQGTYHYLMLALGAVAVLVFVSLGLPDPVLTQTEDATRFVVVGLCGLLVLGVFISAMKERLTRRFRV